MNFIIDDGDFIIKYDDLRNANLVVQESWKEKSLQEKLIILFSHGYFSDEEYDDLCITSKIKKMNL